MKNFDANRALVALVVGVALYFFGPRLLERMRVEKPPADTTATADQPNYSSDDLLGAMCRIGSTRVVESAKLQTNRRFWEFWDTATKAGFAPYRGQKPAALQQIEQQIESLIGGPDQDEQELTDRQRQQVAAILAKHGS